MTSNESRSTRWTRLLAALILLGGVTAWAISVAAPTQAATDPGRAAADYLRMHAADWGLQPTLADLTAQPATATLGGSVVRYQQVAAGWPVHDAEVTVTLDKAGKVLLVVSSYKPLTAPPALAGNGLDAKQAAARAETAAAMRGMRAPQADAAAREV